MHVAHPLWLLAAFAGGTLAGSLIMRAWTYYQMWRYYARGGRS